MKKLICLLLAAVSVASLAACSKADEDATTTAPIKATDQNTEKFSDVPDAIPIINSENIQYTKKTNDLGHTYTFDVDSIDYNGIRNYVKQLEAAGYKCYNPTNLAINKTEDTMPETLPEGQREATWKGNLRSFYVAIVWYDEDATITFYTYNPFESTIK